MINLCKFLTTWALKSPPSRALYTSLKIYFERVRLYLQKINFSSSRFERIIENLEEEETLTLGDQTFLNEMILDESIQCSILGTLTFFEVDIFKNIDKLMYGCKNQTCSEMALECELIGFD